MTGYNSQTAKGEYKLQFETDDYDKFRYVEEAARRCVDNRRIEVCSPVVHAHWKYLREEKCAFCTACKSKMNPNLYGYGFCPLCGARMDGKENEK